MLTIILIVLVLILLKTYNVFGIINTGVMIIPGSEYSDLMIYKSRYKETEANYWKIKIIYEQSQKPPKYKVGDELILNRPAYYNTWPAAINQEVKIISHNGLSAGFYHNMYTCADLCGNPLKGDVFETELSGYSDPCSGKAKNRKKAKS